LAYEVARQLIGRDLALGFVGLLGEMVPVNTLDYVPRAAESVPVHVFSGDPIDAPASAHKLHSWKTLLPPSQIREVMLTDKLNSPSSWMRIADTIHRRLRDGIVAERAIPEMRYQPLIPIQSGRADKPALYCFPGAGDSITGFMGLCNALGDAWTVYGFQPRGTDGILIPHFDVEAAARCYLRAIDARPPAPVHLLGHSFGGYVALEVAIRCRAANRPVASLTLVDSEAPDFTRAAPREYGAMDIWTRFIQSLELAAERVLGVDHAVLEASDARRLEMVHAGAVRVGLLPARSSPQTLAGSFRTFGAALRSAYTPSSVYPGPVRLAFAQRVREGREALRFSTYAWQKYLPNSTSWQGPGNHMTILKPPHVQDLADWWRQGSEA
jgi:thioesterase domain-containing protein